MADTKISALIALTAPAAADLLPIVDDPSGTPVTKKITLSDLFTVANLAIDTANTLEQRNSTNAQTFNIYNTYTDGSNYERAFVRWVSNALEIGAESAGTGSDRNVIIKAPSASNIIDLRVGGGIIARATNGAFYSLATTTLGANGAGWTSLHFAERSSDPSQPSEGNMVQWLSDGTGLGDDGDVIIGVQAGGAIKYTIIHDHSAATTWT